MPSKEWTFHGPTLLYTGFLPMMLYDCFLPVAQWSGEIPDTGEIPEFLIGGES